MTNGFARKLPYPFLSHIRHQFICSNLVAMYSLSVHEAIQFLIRILFDVLCQVRCHLLARLLKWLSHIFKLSNQKLKPSRSATRCFQSISIHPAANDSHRNSIAGWQPAMISLNIYFRWSHQCATMQTNKFGNSNLNMRWFIAWTNQLRP